MQGVIYRNEDGQVYSFKEVLEFFDNTVVASNRDVSLVYSPKYQTITITNEPLIFVFTEQ